MNVNESWAALSRWYDTVGPVGATISLLRVISLALAAWLVSAATLQVVTAVLPRPGRARRLADLISPRSLQRLGHGLAGLSLTAGLAAPAPGAGILAGEVIAVPAAAVDEQEPFGDEPAPPPGAATHSSADSTATMRRLDAPPAPVAVPAPPRSSEAAADLEAAAASQPPAELEATVEVGDSFWSIAVGELTDAHGAPPTDRQVVPYWRRLIELNRDRLVDPGNPDLLYPGQRLLLPPP